MKLKRERERERERERVWAWERMKVAFEVKKKNGMGESWESSLCVLGMAESCL